MGLFDKFKKILPSSKQPRRTFPRASVENDTNEMDRDLQDTVVREESLRARKAQFVFPLREEAEIHFRRGNAYFKIDNYARALSDYSRAIELYPDHLEARYNRAVTYKALGDFSKAVEDLTWVIEFDPSHVRAYEGRAALYNTLKDPVSEQEDMKAAARLGSHEMRQILASRGIKW